MCPSAPTPFPIQKTMRKKQSRRVRFNNNVATSSSNDISTKTSLEGGCCFENKEDLWFTSKELRYQRAKAAHLGEAVFQRQQMDNRVAYAAVIQRTYSACELDSVPDKQDLQLLVHWIREKPSRRGIEKLCVPDVSRSRQRKRLGAVQSILTVQQQTKFLSPPLQAVMLQVLSEKLSKTARVHARVFGIADATAAKDNDDDEDETNPSPFKSKRSREEVSETNDCDAIEIMEPPQKRSCMAAT